MKRLLAALLCMGLAACASVPPPQLDTPQSWQERAQLLQDIKGWELHGRIAIQTGDDSWSGSLNWLQRQASYHIQFSGPLGQGNVSLIGDAQQVLLRTPDGDITGSRGPETLLLERLGWHVPVTHLQHWVLGRPSPEAPAVQIQLDDQGRLRSLRQTDWTVDYRRYRAVGALELPDKVFITNHRLSVRLVIDQWLFPDPLPDTDIL